MRQFFKLEVSLLK